MKKRLLTVLGPLAGTALFCIAVFVLHHELRLYRYRDIMLAVQDIPYRAMLWAVIFTIANFMVLGCYEILGFRYIKTALAWPRIFMTSFIAYSFSNSVGFYSISGSAVRFRLYSQWNIPTFDITKLVTFSSGITFWLGLFSICACVFIVDPVSLPTMIHLPFGSTRALGVLFLLPVLGFIILTIVRKKPLRVRSWEFDIPSIGLTTGLIALACLDWLCFSAVLYSLLPHGFIPFPIFLSVFLAAQTVGIASHVPGGIGVFESAFIALLPSVHVAAVVGAALVFRLTYYLMPLTMSALVLGVHEISLRVKKIGAIAETLGQWGSGVVPQLFSVLTFVCGIILLFSGATPAEHQRMHWLTHLMPLPVLEISHFMASIFGVFLLILAWGIYHRRDSAYHLTLYMLAGGAIFSLLKGIDYEESIILFVMLLALAPCGRFFYRKTSFINDRFSLGWFVAVCTVIASSIWLGFFSFKHLSYTHELWWQFSFHGHASRFLRASVGVVVVFCSFGILRLIAPIHHRRVEKPKADEGVVRAIIKNCSRSAAQLALLGDKSFLVNEKNDAFIMYAVSGRSWIAMGDPIGNQSSFQQLIWQFGELCDQHNGWPVFYEVSPEYLPLYLDIRLTFLKLGEEAMVDLSTFSIEGGSKKSLRHSLRRIEQEGFSFDIIRRENLPAVLPALKKISDEWMLAKRTREKRFSLGKFDERYLLENPVAVIKMADEIVAFANIWTTENTEELSVDLMRHSAPAPRGTMDFLFTNLMLWGKAQGYRRFDLGMAPFSGIDAWKFGPLWNKLGSFLFTHGEEIYNFQGLRQYKEKFNPIWQPKYLAVPGGFKLPLILRDVSSLISGGIKGVFAK